MNMNATTEQPTFTIETEITKALRAQRVDLPRETARLEARIAQLKARRDPLAQAVIEARVKVRAGLAKQAELDRVTANLDQIDAELRGTEIAFDEVATTHRVITMELAEQLARNRSKVATELTEETKRQVTAIAEWLAAGQPVIDALLALQPAVEQFRAGASVTGYAMYHRELSEDLVRVLNFWTKRYNGGCDLAELRARWQSLANGM
jgi:hypothetical protein